MANERILIVDDEVSVRQMLKKAFEREKMVTVEAATGTEALEIAKEQPFDLIILDYMLPDVDGCHILQQLRRRGDVTPILLISGNSEELDQVLGLGMGADDYITKPFHIVVLIHKIKAMIRRAQVYNSRQNRPEELTVGVFTYNAMLMECYKQGVLIPFTGRELALFRYFMEHPNQLLTKEQLYHQVWNNNIVDDNTVMVYIKRIRKKIGDSSKNPIYIKTARGAGYVFHSE